MTDEQAFHYHWSRCQYVKPAICPDCNRFRFLGYLDYRGYLTAQGRVALQPVAT